MSILADRLTNRIEVWGKTKYTDTLKETNYKWDKIKSIWAEILPVKGVIKSIGDSNYADTSYKITVRKNAIQNLNDSMYFKYENMRFDIDYFQPHFKERNLIEIFCSVKIENSSDVGVIEDE